MKKNHAMGSRTFANAADKLRHPNHDWQWLLSEMVRRCTFWWYMSVSAIAIYSIAVLWSQPRPAQRLQDACWTAVQKSMGSAAPARLSGASILRFDQPSEEETGLRRSLLSSATDLDDDTRSLRDLLLAEENSSDDEPGLTKPSGSAPTEHRANDQSKQVRVATVKVELSRARLDSAKARLVDYEARRLGHILVEYPASAGGVTRQIKATCTFPDKPGELSEIDEREVVVKPVVDVPGGE